jgi:hypothetical protein
VDLRLNRKNYTHCNGRNSSLVGLPALDWAIGLPVKNKAVPFIFIFLIGGRMDDLSKQLKLVVDAMIELAHLISSVSHTMEAVRKLKPKDEVTEILHREGLLSPSYDGTIFPIKEQP